MTPYSLSFYVDVVSSGSVLGAKPSDSPEQVAAVLGDDFIENSAFTDSMWRDYGITEFFGAVSLPNICGSVAISACRFTGSRLAEIRMLTEGFEKNTGDSAPSCGSENFGDFWRNAAFPSWRFRSMAVRTARSGSRSPWSL
ncbi:hypothetical protein [Nocardiopsis rhodophaea]|uniref:hypothetical protein n=1 Tax=Nocardiopsis rhodophaea TaxID=280238 RepID=UPI0031D457E5